mgnify:CR=1 FL=1
MGEKRTTTLVKSIEIPAGTYSYEYNKLGNIISVANGINTVSYEYDGLNQLTRVNYEKALAELIYAFGFSEALIVFIPLKPSFE